MVIYNTREMSSKFVEDNKIVEINSPIKDVSEAIEKVREELKKETPDLSDFSVAAYRYSQKEFSPLVKGNPTFEAGQNVFDTILSELEFESLSDNATLYTRPQEFVEFEHLQFNLPTNMTFQDVEIGPKELLDELMSSYGILPTLWEEDKPIAELKALSTAGENLIRLFNGDRWKIGKFNAIPPLSWIEKYQALTPYEKRIINSGRIHPAKIMQVATGVKEFNPNAFLRKEMVDYIIERTTESEARVPAKQVIDKYTTFFAEQNKEMLEKAEEVFKAKFHGHAPRVLAEYMEGALAIRGISPREVTDEQLEEIAAGFNQQSVSKVAKYRNPVLLALTEKIDFSRQKDSTVQVLGSMVATSTLKSLADKKFPEWLNENFNIKPEEVLTIADKIEEVDNSGLNPATSVKDVIAKINNRKGYEDCLRFEENDTYKRRGYKFKNNEIAIKGRNIVCKQGNLTMRMLPADDYANFTVGISTHCCQRYGDAGETCVYKYTSDPFAAAVVIERGDKVVAQGFVWVDVANDTFVFDNVELDSDREVSQFSDLFATYAKALPYSNVQVGTGYNQGMAGWGKAVNDVSLRNNVYATMPTTVNAGHCYSDYHTAGGSIARTIKHNGSVLLRCDKDVQVIEAPDEATKWDELAKSDLCFMLNDCSKSIDERIEIAKAFRENPTDELQLEIVRRTPIAIASLDNPCEEVQLWVLNNHPELINRIKNPINAISVAMLEQDPTYITVIENPTSEQIQSVVARNPLLLEYVLENISTNVENLEDVCVTAVSRNGYVLKSIPEELRTGRVQLAAAVNSPKIISMLTNEEAIMTAIEASPDMIALLDAPSEAIQLAAVERKPSVINQINNPEPSAVRLAVSENGLMIRNFQYEYPELRTVAVTQNPYALRCLRNQTMEEVMIATAQNPDCIHLVKNEEIKNSLLSRPTEQPILFDEPEFA